MTEDSTKSTNKYFCNRCKDKNWLIECKCGCEKVLTRYDRCRKIRYYLPGHHMHLLKGRNNPNYKGGISGVNGKYETIFRPHHKYAHRRTGRIQLHRYRMELMLGRYLTPEEVVHHIDGDAHNNEESNLMLFGSNREHMSFENKKDKTNTFCNLCGDKARIRYGRYEDWYIDITGYLCDSCYHMIKYYRKKMGL